MNLALLLAVACMPEHIDPGQGADTTTPDDTSTPDHGLYTLATIQGVITREVGLYGDGYGTLIVNLLLESLGSSGEPFAVTERAWATHEADFSEEGATVAYSLSNIFPREQPFYVLALFFEDENAVMTAARFPEVGDIYSDLPFQELSPVEVREGGVHELDIALNEPIFYDPEE